MNNPQKFKLSFKNKVKSEKRNFRPLAYKVCRKVLQYEEYPDASEASLTLVSDGEMRELNNQYRQLDRTTDVLSFPMGEPNYDEKSVVLGDIVISLPTAFRQAEEYGNTIEREMAFLIVHGMLHLLGYDHMTESDEKIMFAKQDDILRELKE